MHTVCIEEVRGLSANDVGQVVLLVVVPVLLLLPVHRKLVVVILGVAHEPVPRVPPRRDVFHTRPGCRDPVLVQVLAGVEGGVSLKMGEIAELLTITISIGFLDSIASEKII